MGSSAAFAELGLAPGASEAEVKAAWRRLVSHWHPDRNPSEQAIARMQRINQAYKVIRRAGGRPSAAGAEPAATAAAAGGAAAAAAAEPAAAPGGRSAPRPTVQRRVQVSLEEAATGCTRWLKGRLRTVCAHCAGGGDGGPGGDCADCGGSGRARQRLWYGWRDTAHPCPACQGSGQARQPCTPCGGTGQGPPLDWRVQVRFPPGVRDGDRLQVHGDRGGAAAPLPVDLDIRVQWLPHPLFTWAADGLLHLALPVDGLAWVAERTLPVPTPSGLHHLSLRRDQRQYRLPGRGFPAQRRGAPGDLVVDIEPVWPERYSADQQILWDQLLASGTGPDGRPHDPRLAAWQRQLQAWQRRPGAAGPDGATP